MTAPITIELQDTVKFVVHYLHLDWRARTWGTFGHREYDAHISSILAIERDPLSGVDPVETR
jgi:hypothetical protein